jgi:hypothetical protein
MEAIAWTRTLAPDNWYTGAAGTATVALRQVPAP